MLNRHKESKAALNEVYRRFPNSAEVRNYMTDSSTPESGYTNAQASSRAAQSTARGSAQTAGSLSIDARTLPSMPPLNDPVSCEKIKSQNASQAAFSGVNYWTDEELANYLNRAEAQMNRAKKVYELAEANAKSHLRSKSFGETDAQFQNYQRNAQSEINRVVSPYVSYSNQAIDIYNSWIGLAERLKQQRSKGGRQ